MFFITFLKALAACLITNSHYTGIYPTDLIANGGLIGDILFFAVSGYCLYQVKLPFARWYGRRLLRCYLPVVLMTAIYILVGCYTTEEHGWLWWFVYPTGYHFVASIVVLYIPYYCIMHFRMTRSRLPMVMVLVAVIYLLVYLTAYDISYYHIDNVREPMIRFLFMESMLLGAWFRQNDEKFRRAIHKNHIIDTILLLLTFVLYFASKLLFARIPVLSRFQIVNQLLIFALLWRFLHWAAALDYKLEKWAPWLKTAIEFIAARTLEIYVVQYVLIDLIRPLLDFPLNWFAVTGAILAAVSLLHWICEKILRLLTVNDNS